MRLPAGRSRAASASTSPQAWRYAAKVVITTVQRLYAGFRYGELHDRGGWLTATRLFDSALPALLEEMHEVRVACSLGDS